MPTPAPPSAAQLKTKNSKLKTQGILPRFLRKLRHPGRTVTILVPIHVVAFLVLYISMLKLVHTEILRTHRNDAQVLMNEVVTEIHPAMVSNKPDVVRSQLKQFIELHALPSFALYHADGKPLFEPSTHDQRVVDFITSGEPDDYWFTSAHGLERMNGVMRIVSTPKCSECHTVGETIGAVAMSLDVTDAHGGTRTRVQLNLAMLIAGWGLVVAFINIGLRRLTQRSVASLQSSLEGDGFAASVPMVPGAMLDPVSKELYSSLKQVIQKQREKEGEMTDRLMHTERLASLGKLAAGLAHEIKNPLAGVQGTIELLRDDCEDDMIHDLYGQMLDELRRVNATIHSLLSFARPAKVSRVDADIAKLLEETVQLLRPGLKKKGIALTIEVAPSVSTFCLDRTQMRHVLLNLVHNAQDAIDKKGAIRIRATELPEGGGLVLAVEDDGPGITEEEQGKVFEPFYTSKFNGTGLGLAVVRSLVNQHGGQIEIQSKPGEGATFLIFLPQPSPAETCPDGDKRGEE